MKHFAAFLPDERDKLSLDSYKDFFRVFKCLILRNCRISKKTLISPENTDKKGMHRFLITEIFSFFFLLLTLVSCNGVPEKDVLDKLNLADDSQLDINPSTKLLFLNKTQQYVASGGNPPYVFSLVNGVGSITPSGLYTAPGFKGQATVRVTDTLGVTKDAVVVVEVELSLSPSTRKLNVNSSFQFSTSGGNPPYFYSIVSGASTISSSGVFSGASTPETATVKVTDSQGREATATVDVGNGPIISPTNANTLISNTFQFSATSGTTPYTWSIVTGSGTVNGTGLFTATAAAGTATVRVMDVNGYYSDANISVYKPNKIAAGEFHTCVVIGDTNEVKCWGRRYLGATGDQKHLIGDELSDMGDNLASVKLPPDLTAEPTSISTNHSSGCAIFTDGLTRCWGYSGHGQNGNNNTSNGLIYGTTESYIVPVPIDISNPIIELARKAQGELHYCGIYQDGTLKCWGYNGYGQLGQNDSIHYGSNLTTASIYNAAPISLGQAVTKVETGGHHTCAILLDGNVKCWGYNNYGQLGLQHTTSMGTAANPMAGVTALDFASNITDLALGQEFTCALTAAGGVKCWGRSYGGSLGRGNSDTYGDGAGEDPTLLADIPLGTGRTATKIDAGYYHICALLDNGGMKCWGYNQYGQLGQEDNAHRGDAVNELGDNLLPINLGTGRTAVDIYVGGHSTCAKLDNGDVKCWGRNYYGNLGLGVSKTVDIGDNLNEMGDNLLPLDLGSSVTSVLQVTPMNSATCALVTDSGKNVVKCFGVENNGALGIENGALGDEPGELGPYASALDLGTTKAISRVIAGGYSNCAHFSDGTAKCWGQNLSWARVLGTGSTLDSIGEGAGEMGTNLNYMVAGGGLTFTKIAHNVTGNPFVCVTLSNNTMKCIGWYSYGALGQDNTTSYNYIPTTPAINLGTGRYALEFSVGNYHACAILDNNTLKCWGYNAYGQLGIGDTNNMGDAAGEMNLLTGIDLGTGVTPAKLCSGFHHNCIIASDGKVKCWGYNAHGNLGLGDTNHRGDVVGEMGDNLPFLNLGTGRTAKQLSCGGYHTCAILDNDKLKCWGYNGHGQLGLGNGTYRGNVAGTMGDSLPYVDLGTGRTVKELSLGAYHSCAVLDNNEVKCWGHNGYGQLSKGNNQQLGDNSGEMGDALIPIALD